jgi:CubicO group peptidase (beta-lactamase class C family)
MNKLFFLFFFLLICLSSAIAQNNDVARKADELLSAYTQQNKFSGTVLIARKGEILFEKAYGYADLEKKKPITLDTEFRIASITKTFTSALILKLAEQKKLSLDDPLGKYIPDYPQGEKIMVKHLLSHTSGIKSFTMLPDYFGSWINQTLTLPQTIAHFKDLPLEFEPGSQFSYSNSNYVVLSYIAEKASSKDLGTLYEQMIVKKLQLQHTGKDANQRNSAFAAKGYITHPQTGNWVSAPYMDIITPAGAGGMYSNVSDLYKWDRSLYTNAVLSAESRKMAFTPFQAGYGYGWQVRDQKGRREVSHSGKTPDGFVSNLIRFPNEEVCIIFLSNYGDVNGQQLSDDLTAIAFNEPYSLPEQKKEVVLTTKELEKFVGLYQLDENFNVTISVEDNKLYALAVGDAEKTEFKAQGGNKFYLKGPEVEIEFIEENGQVKYLFINMQGGMKLKKVS